MNISYYFDFDHEDGRADDAFARDTISLLREWRADGNRGMLEQPVCDSGEVEILDTRRQKLHAPVRAKLDVWKAAVFLACDRSRSLLELAALPAVREANVGQSEIAEFLGRCVQHELIVTNQRSWLNVAVHVPAREASGGKRRLRAAFQSAPL
jgi:hypothetical protein